MKTNTEQGVAKSLKSCCLSPSLFCDHCLKLCCVVTNTPNAWYVRSLSRSQWTTPPRKNCVSCVCLCAVTPRVNRITNAWHHFASSTVFLIKHFWCILISTAKSSLPFSSVIHILSARFGTCIFLLICLKIMMLLHVYYIIFIIQYTIIWCHCITQYCEMYHYFCVICSNNTYCICWMNSSSKLMIRDSTA